MDLGKGPRIYVLNKFASDANAIGWENTLDYQPASLLSAFADKLVQR